MTNIPPGLVPILFGIFLITAAYFTPTTTKFEDVFNGLDYLSNVLTNLMKKHPRFREFHQKSVPILLNHTANETEKKTELLVLLKEIKPFAEEDGNNNEGGIEAQETVDRIMKNHNFSEQFCISKYFHDDQENGLKFYETYWRLFAEDEFIDASSQERKQKIRALIAKYLGKDMENK